eukprot:CAMPEP_0172645758 /NCGR_PEP_ID=MMETSP1068-20121228/239891_1 /TAXON_ID=35684 /ORGANISM="Pseudopedinella elastica, Strain CCMP716" /LENGTH=219 /DNA_ID=CAMNT_0013460005 /DNA_START=1122 /DNA_END=1783 /DNA_ORIENTATION=-
MLRSLWQKRTWPLWQKHPKNASLTSPCPIEMGAFLHAIPWEGGQRDGADRLQRVRDLIKMLNAVHFLGPTKGQRGAPADFSSSSSSSVAVGPGLDLRPADLIDEIDAAAEWIQDLVNNGCYRCGFSTRQEAYDEAAKGVVEGLTRVEALLETSGGPFLLGGRMTELDVRLLPTALRFDAAYAPLFRAGSRDERRAFLLGGRMTELDVRLLPTALRFDAA